MSSLTQLHQEYVSIMSELEANNGELTEALEQDLIKNLTESKEKVNGYCLVLDRFENEIDFVKKQMAKAKEYIERLEHQKEKLESVALKVITERGGKLEGEAGRWISTRKSTRVNIIDPDLIPASYIKMKVEPDKTLIKEALNRGEQVEGAELIESKGLSWK